MTTIVEIGSSKGLYANFVLKQVIKPEILYFAVDPLVDNNSFLDDDRLSVRKLAIGSVAAAGEKKFIVRENPELSGFLAEKSELEEIWSYLGTGMTLTETRHVETMTLMDFMNKESIDSIDFLKVDCQGSDVDIVLSAYSRIADIYSFVIELPVTDASSLYKDETTLIDAISIFEKLNFQLYRVVPNGGGEVNAFFYSRAKSLSWYMKLEEELLFDYAPCLKIDKCQHKHFGTFTRFKYFLGVLD